MSQYQHERPIAFTSKEIVDNFRAMAAHPRRRSRSSLWEAVQMMFIVAVMTALWWFLYWPVARAFVWGILWLCKITGNLDADLPPYTPYPNDI